MGMKQLAGKDYCRDQGSSPWPQEGGFITFSCFKTCGVPLALELVVVSLSILQDVEQSPGSCSSAQPILIQSFFDQRDVSTLKRRDCPPLDHINFLCKGGENWKGKAGKGRRWHHPAILFALRNKRRKMGRGGREQRLKRKQKGSKWETESTQKTELWGRRDIRHGQWQ